MKLYFYLIGLFFSFSLYSQTKIINGYVFFLDENDVEGIYITNKNTRTTSVTNKFGNFSVVASLGDTLLVEGPLIKDKKFVLDASEFSKDKLRIYLEPYYITLKEVVIKKKLTGIIAVDAKLFTSSKHKELEEKMEIPNYKGKNREVSYPAMSFNQSIIPMPNIDALYDIISGDRKRRETLFKYEDKQETVAKVRAYYGEDYFIKELEIPQSQVDSYIEYVYDTSPMKEQVLQRDYFSITGNLEAKRYIFLLRLKNSTYWRTYEEENKVQEIDKVQIPK